MRLPPLPTACLVATAAVLGSVLVGAVARAGEPAEAVGPTFPDVAAIFQRSCTHCHGGARPVQGLGLDSHAAALKGAASGPVVVPGSPEKSPLVGRLRGTVQPQMPYDAGPLPEAEIRAVEEWIRAGAKDAPPPEPAPAAPVPPEPGPKPDQPVTWREAGPVLRASCVRCHQSKGLKGPPPEGILLDTHAAAVGGRERVVVVPGRPDSSPLVRVLVGHARRRMPLDGPPWLPDTDVDLLRRWVRDGARGEDGKVAAVPTGGRIRLFGTWDGASRLDGAELVLDAGTRVDKGLAAHAKAEVRGTVLEDGRVRVERIRPREAEDSPR